MYVKDKAREIIIEIVNKMLEKELSLTYEAPSSVIFHVSMTSLIIINS